MSVKLREKRGKLYLDIYQSGTRTWEALHLELTKDKTQNKEIWHIAELCRSKREMQLLAGAWDINDPIAGKISLIAYLEKYSENYKNPSMVKRCIHYVKEFHSGSIQLIQVTPKWINDFQNFLLKKDTLSRSSVSFYAGIVRSALKQAVSNEIILKSPADVVQRISAPEPEMVFLNIDEMQALAKIVIDEPYAMEVRRAFLFACYTGLRISDLETLTWGKITTNPMQIIKSQEKTKAPTYIPLNKSAQALIVDGKPHAVDENVFNFTAHSRRVSYTYLKAWAEAAGIQKTIGWHTARRTFATMALEHGADIYTVAKLLGHSSISNVTKYAKVTDKLRLKAINALPEIEL
ncbi:MAG: site-specific integrase [Treponema sp.]|jgi:integrase|nr:site-specific integrase [Treponema sp.]